MIIYGANIKPLTGELTVTHILFEFDGSEDEYWTKYSAGSAAAYAMGVILPTDIQFTPSTIELKCNYLTPIPSNATWVNYDYFVSMMSVTNRLYTGYRSITTVEDWKAYLAEHPLQVLGQLVTPVTYQLTPTEVRSLLGVNNVWADCGAVTELKYIRDLNLCINDIIARIEALEGASNSRSLSVSPVLTKSLTSDSDTAEGKTEEETEEETKEEAQNER